MTDPKRLIEAEDLGADLLASARTDAPSRRGRARAAAALGIGAGVAATTTAGTASAGAGAGAVATKVGSAGLLTKIVGGTLIVAVAGGGTAFAVREASRPAPTAIATLVRPPRVTPTPHSPITTATIVPTSVDPSMLPDVEPAPAATSPMKAVARAAPASSSQESALARELRSIDAAKALLEHGDANAALAALERHDRDFPNGSLRAESSMLRVEALLATGNEASAKSRARELLAREPNGPHAKRLRSIVER